MKAGGYGVARWVVSIAIHNKQNKSRAGWCHKWGFSIPASRFSMYDWVKQRAPAVESWAFFFLYNVVVMTHTQTHTKRDRGEPAELDGCSVKHDTAAVLEFEVKNYKYLVDSQEREILFEWKAIKTVERYTHTQLNNDKTSSHCSYLDTWKAVKKSEWNRPISCSNNLWRQTRLCEVVYFIQIRS